MGQDSILPADFQSALLWIGNNAQTFSHYPDESIDLRTGAAFDALKPEEGRELDRIGSELGSSKWFAGKGLAYIDAHPALTARNALRKIAAGFRWRPNPRREALAEVGYALSYAPVLVLGLAGAVLYPRDWRSHVPVYVLFFNFLLVTAVFWAHTSHRSHLDVYLIVFAAAAVERIISTLYDPLGLLVN